MHKCEGVTKYKCLECFTFVCNICSKFREDHDIYNEEEKLAGQSSSQMKKRQQTLEVKTKTKQNKKQKKTSKLMNILRHNKNLLTVTEWLQ